MVVIGTRQHIHAYMVISSVQSHEDRGSDVCPSFSGAHIPLIWFLGHMAHACIIEILNCDIIY